MFLGALKITTIFVFGFFTVVTIPSYVEAGAPVWQTAGLVVASVIPLLAVWYMTSPMVMWMHIPVPKKCLTDAREMDRFIQHSASNAELAITTMGPLGKARITKLPLKDLRPEKRRLGLVNYVRDARQENANRRWYHFRAVSQFKIEDNLLYNKKTKEPWIWYKIQEALKNKSGESAHRRHQDQRSRPVQKFIK
ncbi:hypothetical protein N0V93_001812 [Gnomoniopsis smithogilvyi]|uniref:Uncharacterized protein n=1 Tax=Gnomoniopsis smithogilvyi TaxID=1191159 RepID=A0A9W9D2Z0_9PEZI|nr:hypothetical protein N0V93_001812 [Gnomoniopsis smithogilvyi]